MVFITLRGIIDATDLQNIICNLYVPNNYIALAGHILHDSTVAHLNTLLSLDKNTEYGMFVEDDDIIIRFFARWLYDYV